MSKHIEEAKERLKLVEKEYKDAQRRTDRMYELERKAREECDRLNAEIDTMEGRIDEIWEAYYLVRDRNISLIKEYSKEANAVHEEMDDCFKKAKMIKYEYEEEELALVYFARAYSRKERRDALNEKVRKLKEAKEEALSEAKYESEGLERACDLLEDELRRAKKDYEKKKSIRERLEREESELLKEVEEAFEEYRDIKI